MRRTQRPNRIVIPFIVALAPLLGTAMGHATPAEATKSASDPSDDNTRVRSLFRKAASVSQEGRYDEAHQLLLDAWTIRQTYDVASSLAQVEMQLKLYRDAAEHLEFCLRNFAPVESEQTLEQAKKAFAEVKTRVATVKLSTNRKGAEIFVDGLRIGTDPLPAAAFVEPGPRKLAARLDGNTAEQALNALAGKEYVVVLQLSTQVTEAKAAESAAATANPVETPPTTPYKPNYVPAIVAASVGSAALVTGVVLFIEASHKDSQRQDQLDQLPGSNRCGAQNPNASACNEIQSLADDARTFRTLSWVSFGTAAAAGVATYFLWPQRPATRQLGLRAHALPSSGGIDFFAGFNGSF